MKRITKKLLSFLLVICMVFGILPSTGIRALADETYYLDITWDEYTTMTFDEYPGAEQYYVRVYRDYVAVSDKMQLENYTVSDGKISFNPGRYLIQYANTTKQSSYRLEISTTVDGTVIVGDSANRTLKYEKLGTPANIKWDGRAAEWDAVGNATGYYIAIFKNGSFCKTEYVTNNKYELSDDDKDLYDIEVSQSMVMVRAVDEKNNRYLPSDISNWVESYPLVITLPTWGAVNNKGETDLLNSSEQRGMYYLWWKNKIYMKKNEAQLESYYADEAMTKLLFTLDGSADGDPVNRADGVTVKDSIRYVFSDEEMAEFANASSENHDLNGYNGIVLYFPDPNRGITVNVKPGTSLYESTYEQANAIEHLVEKGVLKEDSGETNITKYLDKNDKELFRLEKISSKYYITMADNVTREDNIEYIVDDEVRKEDYFKYRFLQEYNKISVIFGDAPAAINITGGKAMVDGKEITEAFPGDKVTVVADEAPEGKVFTGWKVTGENAEVTYDVESGYTFIMPDTPVTIQSEYKYPIRNVKVTCDVPKAGNTPGAITYNCTSEINALAGTMKWYESVDGKEGVPMTTATFEAGKYYYIDLRDLTVNDKYILLKDSLQCGFNTYPSNKNGNLDVLGITPAEYGYVWGPLTEHNTTWVDNKPAEFVDDENGQGMLGHFECSHCDGLFKDAEGRIQVTAEELMIAPVAEIHLEYKECIAKDLSLPKPKVSVIDANGEELYEDDYEVKYDTSGFPFGEHNVTIIGDPDWYDISYSTSYTVHFSSTMRFPETDSEYNHGAYVLEFKDGNTMVTGDDRVLMYASLNALMESGVITASFSGDKINLDVDKDGSKDISYNCTDDTILEGGAPGVATVLSTCSVKDNMEFTLSQKMQDKLMGKLGSGIKVPFFDKIILQINEDSASPCEKGHTLVKVEEKEATCILKGNKEYYRCQACGKWFEDEAGTKEITSHKSVYTECTSHHFTAKFYDEAHLKDEAKDCLSYDAYWYGCSECGAVSDTEYFVSKETGVHKYKAEWNKDYTGHWHECEKCGEHDYTRSHTPGPEATATTPRTCTVCGYIITPAFGHTHNTTLVPSKEATCTAKGNKAYYTCDGCEKWFEDAEATREIKDHRSIVVEKKAHNYGTEWSKDGTGHWQICNDCGAASEVHAHTPGAEATETTPQTCTECGYIITPALGHTHSVTAVAAKAATCTEKGNKAYYICSGCGKWFEDEACTTEITDHNSVVIAATGHSYKTEWNKGDASGHWHECENCGEHSEAQAHVPGAAATETTPQTCTECGYIITPALTHTHHTTLVEAKESTCTVAGNKAYYTCDGCEKWFEDAEAAKEITDHNSVVVEKKAHNYGTEWSKDGTDHWHVCKDCGAYDTKHAHTPGAAATATTPQTCTECGYIITPALGEPGHIHHTTAVAAKAATCTETGNKAYYTCEGCDKWFEDAEAVKEITDHNSVVVEKKAHDYDTAWKSDSTNHWHVCKDCGAADTKHAHTTVATTTKATTSKNGKIEEKCSECGKVVKNTVIQKVVSVNISVLQYTYSGKAKTPSVTVMDNTGKKLVKGTDYLVTYASGRTNVGKYPVKVTLKGKYSGSKTLYFSIVPKTTSISSIKAGSKKVTLKWKKQSSQTTGYEIQYSTSSKFKGAKTIAVTKNKTISKTITKLKSKKKYYVRIRTYKSVKVSGKTMKIYSTWSKAKTVTVK